MGGRSCFITSGAFVDTLPYTAQIRLPPVRAWLGQTPPVALMLHSTDVMEHCTQLYCKSLYCNVMQYNGLYHLVVLLDSTSM